MDPRKNGSSAAAQISDYCEPGYRGFPVNRYDRGPAHYPNQPWNKQYYRLEITRTEALFLPPDLQESVIKYFAKRHPADPETVVLHASEIQIDWFTAAREAHQRRFGPGPFANNTKISSIPQAMFNTNCFDDDMCGMPPIKPQLEECIPVKVQKEVKINSSNIEL